MQRGFASFWINFVVFTLILALIGGYIVWKINAKWLPDGRKACTLEAKVCPDGSSVGRTGPNCEFAVCPSVKPSPIATSSVNPTN